MTPTASERYWTKKVQELVEPILPTGNAYDEDVQRAVSMLTDLCRHAGKTPLGTRPLKGTLRVEVLLPGGPRIQPVAHTIEMPEELGEHNRIYARRLALGVASDVERLLMSSPTFTGQEDD